MTDAALISAAVDAAKQAYCPYSHFSVGAALLAADGTVITGVNVENASYGLTICAERSAICKAVTAGLRDFETLAVAADGAQEVFPCGACLQVLCEFCGPDLRILTASISPRKEQGVYTLADFLPNAFHASVLKHD